MFETVKTKQKLLDAAKEAFDDAYANDAAFQKKSKESFDFRDNEQWDKSEKEILAEERRPALTFNVVKSHIDLIMGLNEDIKKRQICRPVGVEDNFLCEVINNVVYWQYQKNDWENEEDIAFESSLICGRGYVGIDFDIDEKRLSEIKITETSIPVSEIRFDPAARKRDLSDASYIIWDRWLSLEDFCVKYPHKANRAREGFDVGSWPKSNALMLPAYDDASAMHDDMNDESDYSDGLDVHYYDKKKNQIRVAHMEYFKYAKKYFFWNPKDRVWLPVPGKLKEFQASWPTLFPGRELVLENTIQKEVWWLQFCGEDILVHAPSPIDYPGFSIVPCFMFGDVSRRSSDHYGIVELMKDAQRELNKRVSQTLNLFNQQVQPGVYAETSAFKNVDQAEQSMKEAGSITWLNDGAVSQNKFQERALPSFPTAVLQMGDYAREMLRYMTGVNPDLLGMNDKRKEAGIVVQLRQQQGMAILKPVFKAYTSMKRQLFERQIRIIMAHMPSDQIKKILGEGERYQVKGGVITDSTTRLTCDLNNVSDIAYDIDAEPESNSLTQNALEVATLMEMQQQGIAVDPKAIISKTNMPVTQKVQWIEYIEAQQKGASDQAQGEMDLENRKLEMKHDYEMAKLKDSTQIALAKLRNSEEKDHLKLAADAEKLQATISRDAQTAQLKLAQIVSNAALGDDKNKHDLLKIMLDADYNRKRLILDTMEVMAEAGMAGDELKLKLVMQMYQAAMDAEENDKAHKVELLKKAIDAMSKSEEVAVKSNTEIVKAKLAERAAKKASVEGGAPNVKGQQTKND